MNDVLTCECGALELEITAQSYSDDGGAFEGYRCEVCGRTGSLTHDAVTGRTTLSGCLE
jgi:hypothetical protein